MVWGLRGRAYIAVREPGSGIAGQAGRRIWNAPFFISPFPIYILSGSESGSGTESVGRGMGWDTYTTIYM